jgi:hypothetical protein
MNHRILSLTGAVAALALAGPALANGTISSGQYVAGIGPNGELYDSDSGIGFVNPANDDYIRPGTPRDSWGISASTGSAYADYQEFGTSNIVGTAAVFGSNTASLLTTTGTGLSVKHEYNFFAPNILSIQQTVTNTNAFAVTNVLFRRNVDLDIAPTEFSENIVGPLGANASVVANSYFGFESPDPSVAYSSPCGISCNVTGDFGMGIDLLLGALGAGESKTFAYYYGLNQPGQTLDALFTQAQGLGLNYLIGGQSSENGSYPDLGAGSGFLGVSAIGTIAGPGVPEPSTWAMMIVGIGFAGAAMRGRNRQPARVRFF